MSMIVTAVTVDAGLGGQPPVACGDSPRRIYGKMKGAS